MYKATARVLLTPNDPTQQLNPSGGNGAAANDPDRYVAGQITIVESEAVAAQSAKALQGVSVPEIERSVSVAQSGQSNVLNISATGPDPARAREIASAVANGYIENRRLAAVSGLQQAADDISAKLAPLQTQIADLDTKIGSSPVAAGATSQLVSPVPPSSANQPASAARQVDPALTDNGAVPTTQEALKAARYAAAVQYETLYAREQELLVDITLKRGDAELIADAKTPTAPVSPHPKRDAALGLAVGLLLGVGIAVARERIGDRVRSAHEVEAATGLPMLSQLPFDGQAAKEPQRLTVLDRPLGPLSEAMRALRTSIQYLGVDRRLRVIVVTSAFPGEGKSLVAANLAGTFAQADYRTLLVSADLRRPSLDTLFESTDGAKSEGLTGVLAPMASAGSNGHGVRNGGGPLTSVDGASAAKALLTTPLPNLHLLPAGAKPPNPAELLGSRRMESAIAGYASSFDVIIIDTPPVLAVTDAAVLAAKADGVVLVAAMNETRRDGLRRAASVLQGTGAQVLGTVVNKVTKSQGYYSYYAKYYGDGDVRALGGKDRKVSVAGGR